MVSRRPVTRQEVEHGVIRRRGQLVGAPLAALAHPLVVVAALDLVDLDVFPAQVGNLAAAAAGVQVGDDQGVVTAAGQALGVDGLEDLAHRLDRYGRRVVVLVNLKAIWLAERVVAGVAVAVDVDGPLDLVTPHEGELIDHELVEGGEGSELAIDAALARARLLQVADPLIRLPAGDVPRRLAGEHKELCPVVLVGPDRVV